MADFEKDVEALDRVLFRLASATDERMLDVLQSLLPQLLKLFPTDLTAPSAAQLKDKILQVVSHVKTRLQALPSPTLPLQALGALLRETDLSVFTHNFAFMFIEIGFRAASQDERGEVLAEIFKALEKYTPSQQEIFFRLLIRALPMTGNAVYPPPAAPDLLRTPVAGATSSAEVPEVDTSTKEMDPSVVGNMEVMLDFLLDFLMFDTPSRSASGNDAPVFGLMALRLERLQRVVHAEEFNKERLYDTQMNALRFIKELEIPSKHKFVHYIAGCASHHHTVKSFCEEQLVRVMKHEYVQLEDAQLMRRIIALILGSQVAQGSGAFTGYEQLALSNRTRLADASILQALTLLSESKAATNVIPMMLQLLCHLMYGAESSRPQNIANKVKLAGVRLCHWTFIHAESTFVEHFLGPVIFPTLLRVLMDPNADSEASQAAFMREFRQGIYESLTVLGTRAPSIVAGSEQAFQVLLVRCLVEEERRTGTGANALKAFTSFSRAYGLQAPEPVRARIQTELIDLLNGSRIFDTSKNYARVRAAIATWCGDLLNESASGSSITMRFALLKLCGDEDQEVQALATKALYTDPLPSLGAVSKYLVVKYPHKDVKASIPDARTVESFLRFCLKVIKNAQGGGEMEIADEGSVLVEYFVQTLLGKSGAVVSGDSAALSGMYQAAATSLVEICAFDKASVTETLGKSVSPLLDVARSSSDRAFLQNIGALVQCMLESESFSTKRAVDEVIQVISIKLDDTSLPLNDVPRLQYVLGSALSVVEQANELSGAQVAVVLAAYEKMVTQLTAQVKTCSNFTLLPRGEEDQNARIDFLRSVLDGIGLAGALTTFLQNASAATDWVKLKRESLGEIQKVMEWDLSGVSSDGSLKLKLTKLKYTAVESLSRATSGLPSTTGSLSDLNSPLEDAVNAMLKLGNEQDPELQLLVGEALVAIGSHEASAISSEAVASEITFAENRAAVVFSRLLKEFAESRQPTVRRSTATWLLCVCAAGLPPSGDPNSAASSNWSVLLRSKVFTELLIETHEFFVTMLNDNDNIAKESAVKGLAYLRLRSPNAELGDQFSDSLFRRLRCFRAFTSTSANVSGLDFDNVDMDAPAPDEPAAGIARPTPPASHTPSATAAPGSTVENAAYREVSNLAADIGDPELMYALLYLSTTDPIWQTLLESSAPTFAGTENLKPRFSFVAVDRAFRLSIIEKAGKLWMDESYSNTSKLVPWLYLLKFHSNSKVSEVMTNLWNFAKGKFVTTSTQEKSLLQQRWPVILKFLLSRLESSRNFKYREAACVALIDLLNGVDADQLRDEFLHLWKLASAAVDDVMEAVCLVGLKLYRYMGELSLRIAASDETCRKILLQYLIAEGIVSKNMICRALGIDILLRLVKALDAESIQDSLASLILKLLEYLSSLEMPELQYAQFHVQKKEQLERLRVSISQSGPVGQLLELSTTRLKELAGTDTCVKIVDELARGVANLLRFGVGLNTRVGSANFVATLAVELPFELRKCRGAELLLTKVFIPFVGNKTSGENDVYGDEESRYGASSGGLTDGLVIQTYCRAAAYLCPLVDAPVVREYVRSGVFAFNKSKRQTSNGGSVTTRGESTEVSDVIDTVDIDAFRTSTSPVAQSSDANRFLLITAIATKELVVKVPPITDASTMVQVDTRNDWYCTHVFPGAFIGQFASTEALKTTWTAVLEELPPSVRYAEASIDATLTSIARFITHTAWDTRKQAALALHALFSASTATGGTSSYRSRVTPQQTERIWGDLVSAVPGRLWKGKGVILDALVALASVKPEADSSAEVGNAGLARNRFLSVLLLEECERAWRNKDMAYMESAISSFGKLSSQMSSSSNAAQWQLQLSNFAALRRAFVRWFGGSAGASPDEEEAADQVMETDEEEAQRFSLPPLMVKCVFESLALAWPSKWISSEATSSATATATETIAWLCESVTRSDLNVWSIRKSVFEALAAVVASAPAQAFAAKQTMDQLISKCCGEYGVRDAKYSMIRVAAASVLVALTGRHRDQHDLALHLLVHKERISETLEVLRASDEPAEQRAAFQTMTSLLELQR
ncbi:hypothetical protein Gpo141_00012561 [Globisporangium polare]